MPCPCLFRCCTYTVATAVAVNAPAVRLIATSRWLIVARQQVNRNRGLLVNVPLARLKV